jgi:peptide-methionine (S)-S-oxide reductase
VSTDDSSVLARATFGGGCFWCTEAVYRELEGVEEVVSGYAGGHVQDPGYREVCTGTTGHAEVVQIAYDPARVSYDELLEVFFQTHDPTTLNRQGNDVGPQYRSVIFYQDDEQRRAAEQVIGRLNASGAWHDPIVTEVSPLTNFFPAEGYHQDYFALHGEEPYCRAVIQPKLEKFRAAFRDRLKGPKHG